MDKAKQEEIFQDWIEKHKGILVKIARSFSGAPQDFDDLFQEILLQLWQSIPSFNGKSSSSTWVYRVSLNRSLVWKRGETRREKLIHTFTQEIPVAEIDSPANEKRTERLYAAIRKLNQANRALVLLALDGLSYREISSIVKITETNVGVRLNRAKTKLAKIVTEEAQ